MKTTLEVPKDYKTHECVINFDNFQSKQSNLDGYMSSLKCIKTDGKGATWGRTYIEIPTNVLSEFGIISTTPIVVYVNYVMNTPYFYCYAGETFSGDAAWFDTYNEVSTNDMIGGEVYRKLKEAIMDKSKSFISNFNSHSQKWSIVPVIDVEKAIIAQVKNNHLK